MVDMVPENLQATMKSPSKFSGDLRWDIFMEKAGIWEEPDFVKETLVDHINTTKDSTDYLWYTTRSVLLQASYRCLLLSYIGKLPSISRLFFHNSACSAFSSDSFVARYHYTHYSKGLMLT